MSQAPQLRRTDKAMPDERVEDAIQRGVCGRLATVSVDGSPYAVPLLYIWKRPVIYFHTGAARGHLRQNIDNDTRACFEIEEAGQVFAYGRFECDTGTSYASVIAFGRIALVQPGEQRVWFFDELMEKYAPDIRGRPKSFYPRLQHIEVFALTVERVTGKETPLPSVSQRWPSLDQTRTPDAVPPRG
jgi:nitroimidazol reductase NimA-like FMN-containing flavoprotein (pyridoxamine 5'-phosphate oxidase superfamily)